ncbi:MAG: hypothetical protein P8008_04550 [Gammaproteobacteria bacterium]
MKGFYPASGTVQPLQRRVVFGGSERFRVADDVDAISLTELCQELMEA